MKKYWTSLTKDYIHDWTPANAVREIVQNALDSPSAFEYSMSGDTLSFTSVGTCIPPKTLLMGNSGKRDDVNSVGGKGEGFKCAAIVLIREGYGLTIFNGGVIWEPSFEYNDDFEEEVLVFNEYHCDNNNNLTFEITGADEDLIKEVKHDCLYLQDDVGEIREGSRGRVLVNRPNKLYVGGLYVCDITGHKYSYDFHPRYLPLNRDRKSVDNWSLGENTSRLLDEVFAPDEIATLIETRACDTRYSTYHVKNDDVHDACYRNLVEKYGENVVVTNDWNKKEELEKRGFAKVVILTSDTLYTSVVRSKLYQEHFNKLESELDKEEEENSPIELLEEWYARECAEQSDSFEEILDKFKERGVQWEY